MVRSCLLNSLTRPVIHRELICDKAVQEGIDLERNGLQVAGQQHR